MQLPHFWQGEWLTDEQLPGKLAALPGLIAPTLSRPLSTDCVLAAADGFAAELRCRGAVFSRLKGFLTGPAEAADGLLFELAEVCSRPNLERKLKTELASLSPLTPVRTAYTEDLFEAWAPLGLLVHISPQNSPASGLLSLLEGLLTGNINALKTGSKEGLFAQHAAAALASFDPSGVLAKYLIIVKLASSQRELLQQLFNAADGVAVWGGEEAVAAVRAQVPAAVRLVPWGHKISLIYATLAAVDDLAVLKAVALEICLLEQQACSSPQCIYLDTAAFADVQRFAQRLSVALAEASQATARLVPSAAEAAEITLVTALHEAEAALLNAEVLAAPDRSWRILTDERPALVGSPLYRSIWVKPLPRDQLTTVLRPMRQYLQTAGLACSLADLASLSERLITAGVDRIRQVGTMLGGYAGEPHDGVYALQQYARRISYELPPEAAGISSFDELRRLAPPAWPSRPEVTPKEAFADRPVPGHAPKLYFKSGGSTGKPKLSTYSYGQYDEHMTIGGEGLYAAGFDPVKDRAMNLFFGGGLYGGFISFFSALERLGAVQLPMAAHTDYAMVAGVLAEQRVNVLLGMPSYIINLFEKEHAALKAYGGISKIFYGGEHFTEAQRTHLKQVFGVQVIRSGAYGSVDIGPLGFQCAYSDGGVHHVQQKLQYLEILQLAVDAPVEAGDIGRLVFSPRSLASNKPRRYEIGDVGRWVLDAGGLCPCGRSSPRFELLGRLGDVFRIGSMFLNYQRFAHLLSAEAAYSGEVQLILAEDGLKETLTLAYAKTVGQALAAAQIEQLCLRDYADLAEAVNTDKTLLFSVKEVRTEELKRTAGSGKLIRVVDLRVR